MRFLRKALLILLALILLAAVWVWWNRPQKVDMSAYVPADALLYLEANDLPDIATGLINTEAWKALASPAGIRSDAGRIGWLSRLASWTGLGPAEAVVFSRAQIAVAVLGFDAADGRCFDDKRAAVMAIDDARTGQGHWNSLADFNILRAADYFKLPWQQHK